MKRHSILSLGLALLGASMLLSGCLTNKVGVRHDGTLAIALYEEGQYEYQMGTEKPEASDIYVTDPQGSTLKRLTYGDELKAAPVWSPDGRWIAYISYQKTPADQKDIREMWVMTEEGEEPRKLYETTGSITDITWNPQGLEVAFHEGAGNQRRISIVDVLTGETLHQFNGDYNFAWSPYGDQLIYVGTDEEVVRFDLNTGSREVLIEGFQSISTLDWLQDGRLVFTRQETSESKPTIYLYDIDSRSLTTLRADASHVGVSPSGQRLLMFVKTGEKEGSPVLLTRRLDGIGGDEVVTEGKIDYAFWVTDELVGYRYVTEKGEGLKVVNLASGESVNLTQQLKEWF